MKFGAYVAARLSGICVVPFAEGEKRTHFQLFNVTTRAWTTRHRDDMASIVQKEIASLAHPGYIWRSKRDDEIELPEPLDDITFCNKIADIVLSNLSDAAELCPVAELDGDHTRGKILFNDGSLFDFETGDVRRALPADRMGHTAGCPYKECEVADGVRDLLASTFADLKTFYIEEGDKALADTNAGLKIIDNLRQLEGKSKLLRVLIQFCGDWDTVFYFLRTVARCAVGEPRFCEFLYIFGPGSSGKDVVMGIFLHFFGSKDGNYGVVVGGHWIVDGKKQKEGAEPFLANTRGKRFVWASEIPKHENLQLDMIKAT